MRITRITKKNIVNFPRSVPSSPPPSVTATSSATTITVQWWPVDCIHLNGDITGYTVRVSASGEAERTVSVDESVEEATMSGLSPFTIYNVSVAAVNSAGTGVYSGDIAIQTESERMCTTDIQQYLPVLYNHLSACVFIAINISLYIEVVVGLDGTVHRVSEDVGIVELCVCVIIPNIPCPVTHSFEVSLSIANISAGIKNDYGVHI